MDIETLRNKALNIVEIDIKMYQEAVDGIVKWEKRECSCGEVKLRWCSKCAWTDHYHATIKRIEERYKSA